MRILLDTNVLIWFLSDDKQLPEDYKKTIENPDNTIYVSIVSLWEIVIKLNIGKLELDMGFEEFLNSITDSYDFNILQIHETHLSRYLKLPLHHRDPFDRLIYVQAKTEGMFFLFTDEVFNLYEADV
jgi:PIN domain nuclease of toxin-antitoxin system